MDVAHATVARRGACGSSRSCRRRGSSQGGTDVLVELNFDRSRPAGADQPERGGGAAWLASARTGRSCSAPALTYTEAMRGELAALAAGAGGGVAHGRLAADPQPRHDRRESRHRPRRPATRCRRCSSRRRWWRWRACAGARSLPLTEFLVGREAKRAGRATSSSPVCGCAPSGAPQTFMKVGPAERDGDRGLLVGGRRRRGARRRCARHSARPRRPRRSCVCRSTRRRRSPMRCAAAARPIDDVRGTAAYRRHALGCSPGAHSRGAPREARADRQRGAPRDGRLGWREPAVRVARAARAARLEERVRAGGVRLVLGAARRRARVLVPRARRAGRGSRGDDRGRARRRRCTCTACRRRSSTRGRCSAASARRASSSPLPRCSTSIRHRRRTRSGRRCPATSAAAPATQRSSTPSGRPAR